MAKLSYKDQRDLDRLPAEIERLEAEIAAVEDVLHDPDLYTRDPSRFAELTERSARLRAREGRSGGALARSGGNGRGDGEIALPPARSGAMLIVRSRGKIMSKRVVLDCRRWSLTCRAVRCRREGRSGAARASRAGVRGDQCQRGSTAAASTRRSSPLKQAMARGSLVLQEKKASHRRLAAWSRLRANQVRKRSWVLLDNGERWSIETCQGAARCAASPAPRCEMKKTFVRELLDLGSGMARKRGRHFVAPAVSARSQAGHALS